MDTFVVRVWRTLEPAGVTDLRGTARHVESGREVRFVAPDELTAFMLATATEMAAVRGREPTPRQPAGKGRGSAARS